MYNIHVDEGPPAAVRKLCMRGLGLLLGPWSRSALTASTLRISSAKKLIADAELFCEEVDASLSLAITRRGFLTASEEKAVSGGDRFWRRAGMSFMPGHALVLLPPVLWHARAAQRP
ncbi:uncharacterized protein SPSK_03702 [Sporothrix schenckii 1099-18]|uniref:Uncharacterized protein n=1 Tax=Sporothrix schenckii 1099-18 TaxID=1397361 RepID=A0A0F2M0N9_SPOSC|nr:uncharacterized protein SPSK_03702 [Sporothrix schenckii 1099-18]KJR82639.1 hypothetical protein SPSK_03702 [Sporothrix schenckii 1099-18]